MMRPLAILNIAWRMWRRKPTFISFNVTNRCTERCPMCVVWREPAEELTLEEIEKIFRQLRRRGLAVVEISGGEPFLRPDIFEILGILDRLGFTYSINTNATLITEETIEKLAACRGLLQVSISLDSLDRERFALLRGVDLLPRVLESLDTIERSPHRIPVKLMVVMSRVNHEEIDGIIEFAKRRELGVSVLPVIQGSGLEHRSACELFDASDEERRAMSALFRQLARRRRAGETLWEYSGFYESAAAYVSGKSMKPCDAGRLFLDLRADGGLAPCVDLPAFASLRTESVDDAMARLGGEAERIRACTTNTPCCYTCTVNVSETASHPARFALEGLRIRSKGGRVLPWTRT